MLAVPTLILLVGTSVLSAVYFCVTTFTRKRRPGEPQVVKGSLIWGSSIDFGTHAVNFLHKCRKTYGNCFTLRLVNQYLTIVMDPHSYEDFAKEKNFDFHPIQKQVNHNVFSFTIKNSKKFIKDTSKTVRGENLVKGMNSFVLNLNRSCDKITKKMSDNNAISSGDGNIIYSPISMPDNKGKWNTDGLRAFAAKTIFDAIFNTVFGVSDDQAFNAHMAYKNFDIFHKYFNYLWLGVPVYFFRPALKALTELLVMPDADELLAREDLTAYLRVALAYMKENGQTEGDIKGHNLVFLHVNYNTFRLAFWALSNLLEDEKARAAVQEEIDNAIDERRDPDTNTAVFKMKDVENLKILDSVCQETIRLASGVFMVRFINEDKEFKTSSDGKTHLMRKGDRVALYPPATHKDPEIFEDPKEFKYDRFVDATFYKDGKLLTNPIVAYGSLCPGKRFANMQLKWYVMTILSRYDLKLQDGEHAQYAYEYHGHEVLPPVKDVNVDIRSKEDSPTLLLSCE